VRRKWAPCGGPAGGAQTAHAGRGHKTLGSEEAQILLPVGKAQLGKAQLGKAQLGKAQLGKAQHRPPRRTARGL